MDLVEKGQVQTTNCNAPEHLHAEVHLAHLIETIHREGPRSDQAVLVLEALVPGASSGTRG